MSEESTYTKKTASELVRALSRDASPGSKLHEEIKGALSVVVTKELTESIDRHQRASSRLALQVLFLNIIFGIFTLLGTILAIATFYKCGFFE